jgi:cysteine desulfurase
MLPWLQEHFGNPSSSHVDGRRALAAVEKARELVSNLLGCSPDEVYFTSGGAEANNLAIFGTTEGAENVRTRIVTSQVEHPATACPCERLEQRGWTIVKLPVDTEGMVSPDELKEHIKGNTALVTIMHAKNKTGTIMPISLLADLARENGALVHTDAAQSIGKIPVRVDDLEADLLSLAGHKVYAPKGIGVLYVRRGTPIRPVLLGAGHERGLRPGTENVPYIVGLGKACEIAADRLEEDAARITGLRDRLRDRNRAKIPQIRLNGHTTKRLPNTLNVSFPGVRGSALLEAAPGIAASTGSACHEGGETPSEVLLALGAVRLSLGRGTTEADVCNAADLLIRAWKTVSTGT